MKGESCEGKLRTAVFWREVWCPPRSHLAPFLAELIRSTSCDRLIAAKSKKPNKPARAAAAAIVAISEDTQ